MFLRKKTVQILNTVFFSKLREHVSLVMVGMVSTEKWGFDEARSNVFG